jgi:hypothetical protein
MIECESVRPSEIADCADLLVQGNLHLTMARALDYAKAICADEAREDYGLMQKLIQNALYGEP